MRQEHSPLDSLFHVLADPTRRAMLFSLATHDYSVTELASPYKMTFPAASKHIKILERAGLISRRIVGNRHVVSATPLPLDAINEWLRLYMALGAGHDGLTSAILAYVQGGLDPG
jgi:DNA-binding transcriptional ArsR family regulator